MDGGLSRNGSDSLHGRLSVRFARVQRKRVEFDANSPRDVRERWMG